MDTVDIADAVTVFPAIVTSLAPVPPLLMGMVFMMLDCDVPGSCDVVMMDSGFITEPEVELGTNFTIGLPDPCDVT